ncbi:class 3 adenylate cyclase [Blastococcus colisei]|uniref:Class 3 adenylate cyclase n=1 Tax=Blastococcus colisei TaxID=1564162 RepID=A0A543PGU9_9ACTN|nr:adenylate/guanylate cyclase domain-containing protein [Blastococcus colisei]TQN43295.1 class 3 adenylate cyclase [Blastococcus colisei]
MDPAGLPRTQDESGRRHQGVGRRLVGVVRPEDVVVLVGLLLPLAGLVFLLRPDYSAVHWTSPAMHFVFFLLVGSIAASLSLVAGAAARRRGDARVFLLSLAFLAISGFMALHAAGTQHVLTDESLPGFTVAITVGLLVAAPFALASAYVDIRPWAGPAVMRARPLLRGGIVVALVAWGAWSLGNWPPIDVITGEGPSGDALEIAAGLAALAYVAAAARLWWVHRDHPGFLVLSVVTCYVLLGEALVGVAAAGERKFHPSWWVWHALIVAGFLLVFLAARREWGEERFRPLYLPGTREQRQEVSVLVGDLAGYTGFAEHRDPAEVAAMLRAYYEVATPLIARRYKGEVEKFAGDGIFATFNRRGDQADHARRAVEAAAALQGEVARIRSARPDWPGLRVGVNSGPVVVSEMGGSGYVVYAAVGDTVNVAARLQAAAPVGGVLVGERTGRLIDDAAPLQPAPRMRVKGKTDEVDAYLLQLPEPRTSPDPRPAAPSPEPAMTFFRTRRRR